MVANRWRSCSFIFGGGGEGGADDTSIRLYGSGGGSGSTAGPAGGLAGAPEQELSVVPVGDSLALWMRQQAELGLLQSLSLITWQREPSRALARSLEVYKFHVIGSDITYQACIRDRELLC